MVAERTLTVTVNILFFSQLCDEIDQNEKNSQDMIEEVKKKIPGNITACKFTCTCGEPSFYKFYLKSSQRSTYLIISRLFNA